MEKVGSKDGYSTSSGFVKEKEIQFFQIYASSNFLRVMGIQVEEGRDFSQADELSEEAVYILSLIHI